MLVYELFRNGEKFDKGKEYYLTKSSIIGAIGVHSKNMMSGFLATYTRENVEACKKTFEIREKFIDENNWLFLYKEPRVKSWTVMFSDFIIDKMKELKMYYLEIVFEDGNCRLIPNNSNGMNLTAGKLGKHKKTINYKSFHHNMAENGFIPKREVTTDVYGYKFYLEWNEEDKSFKIFNL